MQELNHSTARPWLLPLGIAVLCVGLQLTGLSETLRFDRVSIEASQWWLLLSCNFVHLGFNHLLLNLAGLALIYFLLWPNYDNGGWIFITLVSSLGVGLGLYLWNPELRWYVGFSGSLHGMIIAGAIGDLRRFPVSGSILLALVVAKLIWEQLYGAIPGSAEIAGGNVVVDSHFYGAICGLICALILVFVKRLKDSPRVSNEKSSLP